MSFPGPESWISVTSESLHNVTAGAMTGTRIDPAIIPQRIRRLENTATFWWLHSGSLAELRTKACADIALLTALCALISSRQVASPRLIPAQGVFCALKKAEVPSA